MGSQSFSVSLRSFVPHNLNHKRGARMTLTGSSKVKFVVEGRSVVGKHPVIGSTAEYSIGNLLELMEKSEQESKDIRDACKRKRLHSKKKCGNLNIRGLRLAVEG